MGAAGSATAADGSKSDASAVAAAVLAGDAFKCSEAQRALAAWCAPFKWECSPPFRVEWYNQIRVDTAGGQNLIEAPGRSVAFVLYSVPGYLDVVKEHFARERPEENFVDACTNEILGRLRALLPPELDPLIVNTDEGPPYYHVQSMGAVAGVAEHLESKDIGDAAWCENLSQSLDESRDTKMWGTDPAMRRKIFGVNVHPIWGGWFVYRGLVILRGATPAELEGPTFTRFLDIENKKRILSEYNLKSDDCFWRDLTAEGHSPEKRYNPEEYFYFTEKSVTKRRRFLEFHADRLLAASGGSPPAQRVA